MKAEKFFLAFFLLYSLFSCSPRKVCDEELSSIAEMMANHPDSALHILQGIDVGKYCADIDVATYSLLYSEALDKNYIDIQSDSIIAPSVDYFLSKGTPDQKIKTCYYRSRISENGGYNDEAMKWLVQGESYVDEATDYKMIGRLYREKSVLYFRMYDFRMALQNGSKAVDYYTLASYVDGLFDALVYIANDYIELGEYQEARASLDSVAPYLSSVQDYLRSAYFSCRLRLSLKIENFEEARAVKDSCLVSIREESFVPWVRLAELYLGLRQPDDAIYALKKYSDYTPGAELDSMYPLLLSRAYEAIGNYQSALDNYKEFVALSGQYDLDLLNSDTRFVEERYQSEIQVLKNQNKLYVLMIILLTVAIVSVLIFFIVRRAIILLKNRLSDTERMYDELQAERDSLLSFKENNASMSSESRQVISKRLAVLNKVLLGHLSSDPVLVKEANASLSDLVDDKKDFIESTTRIFYTSHPKMIQFLRESGLTDVEMGYCCLYLMGMHSKDMDPYFSRNSSNNMNNSIRRKLAIPQNGQKLKTYLSDKMLELENN